MMNAGPSVEPGVIPDAAQGVIGRDGNTVYQIAGRGETFDGARIVNIRYVSDAEGAELLAKLGEEDPDDNDPEVPDGSTPEHIPSRAELAERVSNLEDKLLAAEILLGVAE